MYTVFYDAEKLGCCCLCTMHQIYANKTLLMPEQQGRPKVFWDVSKLARATAYLSDICLSNTPEPLSSNPLVAMTSQVLIASPKCIERIIDSIHLLTNPLLSLFSNAFPAAPVYCHTRSEHFCIPRRRDIQLKDQINHLTTPFRKSYLFADLCCLPAPQAISPHNPFSK